MAADGSVAHQDGQRRSHLHGIPALEAFRHFLQSPGHLVRLRAAMLPQQLIQLHNKRHAGIDSLNEKLLRPQVRMVE